MGMTAPVALRINPDVDAGTHEKISTGRRHDKFGIAYEEAPAVYRAGGQAAGRRTGRACICISARRSAGLEPFEAAYRRGIELFTSLRAEGIPLRRLDLGGGFGVRYLDEPRIEAERLRARWSRRVTAGLDCELLFEPGRSLVAEAGVLLSTVIYLKEAGGRRFLVLDFGHARPDPAGDVRRLSSGPAGARSLGQDEPLMAMDVVGPICESSDVLGRDRHAAHAGGRAIWWRSPVPAPTAR